LDGPDRFHTEALLHHYLKLIDLQRLPSSPLEALKDLAFHQLAKQSQGERQLQKVSEFLKATFQQRA
jgi:hypothetical protein